MTIPGGPPEWPDASVNVRKGRLRRRVELIPAGTYLIRAYTHDRGFSSDSFNPTEASLTDPNTGGRFDGTASDPFSFTYLAIPHSKPHVAFWETFQNDVSYSNLSSGARHSLILKTDLRARSFAYLRVLQPLRLLRMRTIEDVGQVRTTLKVMRGDDRLKTRAWVRFIRTLTGRNIHGLMYVSAVIGDSSKGDAIVLFGDKCVPGKFIETDPPEIPMDSAAGTLLVDEAIKGMPIRRAL